MIYGATFKENGIGLVINMATELPALDYGPDVRLVRFEARDTPGQNLKQYFPVSRKCHLSKIWGKLFSSDIFFCIQKETTKLIHEAHENQVKCMVHCIAGVSRSATVCVAYLMKYRYSKLGVGQDSVLETCGIEREMRISDVW